METQRNRAMTGQGNKQYEQIKKNKSNHDTLDLNKKYRTASGHSVRNLQAIKTNKALIAGRVIETAHYHYIITGQVLYQDKWYDTEWKANGQHTKPAHSLVEQQEDSIQGNLF